MTTHEEFVDGLRIPMKKYYQKLKENQHRKKEFSVDGVSTENKKEITRLLEKNLMNCLAQIVEVNAKSC